MGFENQLIKNYRMILKLELAADVVGINCQRSPVFCGSLVLLLYIFDDTGREETSIYLLDASCISMLGFDIFVL